MEFKLIDPLTDPRWDHFVKSHPQGSFYHHSVWGKVIYQTFPHVHPVYSIIEQDGQIAGLAPFFFVKSVLTGKRLIALPFTIYADPLVHSDEGIHLLIDNLLNIQKNRNASFIQIRTRFSSEMFREKGFEVFSGFKNHVLNLENDLELIWKSFDRTCVRQRIQRAEKSGVAVSQASDEADVKAFFRLHSLTRKQFGIPPQPYTFFRNMWEILHPKGMFDIFIARVSDRPVSSLLCFKYKTTVHAEYMGTDHQFKEYSGNILLFWHAIQKSKADGYRAFEFGASPNSETSLIRFKQRWGTREEELQYCYFPSVVGFSSGFGNSGSYRFLSWICRRLPSPLFELAGKFLYRHLGG